MHFNVVKRSIAITTCAIILIEIVNLSCGPSKPHIVRDKSKKTDRKSPLPPPKGNVYTRDFQRYICKDRRRIGGEDSQLKHANDPLWRIDGAWFVW